MIGGIDMRIHLFLSVLFFTILGVSSVCVGKNHYIRSDGGNYGQENGSDWNNAYDGLPAVLVRGDTYVIAGGNYVVNGGPQGGYVFNDTESGSAVITIRKASASLGDSSVAGWQSSFQNSQAVFSGNGNALFQITRDYYKIDGITGIGDGSTETYGIKLTYSDKCNDYRYIRMEGSDNIEIAHIEFAFAGQQSCDPSQTGIMDRDNNHTHIHHNLITNTTYGLSIGGPGTDNIYEYNYFKGGWGSSNHHQDYIPMYGRTNKKIIRYNVFDNVVTDNSTGLIVFMGNASTHPDWYYNDIEIYGNVFVDNAAKGNGAITTANSGNSCPASGWKIYNNTFVNSNAKIEFYTASGSGNEFYNNVMYNSNAKIDKTCQCMSKNNNYYNNNYYTSTPIGSNSVSSSESTSSLFVDYAGKDFRLKANSDAIGEGKNLGSAYNTDMFGVLRGASWDIGAFQYTQSSQSSIIVPRSFSKN